MSEKKKKSAWQRLGDIYSKAAKAGYLGSKAQVTEQAQDTRKPKKSKYQD